MEPVNVHYSGKSLPHFKFALDEIIYVLDGRGLTTFWEREGGPWKTFEWQKYSMFLIPRNYRYQLSNSQGNKPVRLLHYNYLPLAMSIIPNSELLSWPGGKVFRTASI